MSDYIKREDAINAFYTATGDGDKAEWCVGVIQSIPAADVVERKVGKWIRCTEEIYVFMCSVCEDKWDGIGGFHYCPNCGADMMETMEDT